MGLKVIDMSTGQKELECTPYVANSIGTINGGAQAVLIEAAAEAMRPGMVASDMQIHYLSQVKTGPARASGTVLRDAADHSAVSVELTDVGNNEPAAGPGNGDLAGTRELGVCPMMPVMAHPSNTSVLPSRTRICHS